MKKLITVAAWIAGTLLLAGCGGGNQPRVVLYCGQDREYADAIIKDFEKDTGIRVEVRSDTEADKSVSLYEAIVRERNNPRCDVFWNGEVLNTIRLQKQGLLAAYPTSATRGYPEYLRARDDSWCGFAGRARILIVRLGLPEADRPRSLLELTDPKRKGRVAMAKPLFGTTATHFVCLWQVLGEEKALAFFKGLKETVTILPGNKDVAIAVAEGRFDVGLTDTDDAIIELRQGRPVTILYPDQAGMGTLFLPNTVAIIQGAPNVENAKRLRDYLLSPAVEQKLAEGRSAQIPLNEFTKAPAAIETPKTVKAMQVDFDVAAKDWEKVQKHLRKIFAQ